MNWLFDQPKNCATLISRAILDGRNAVLYVSHDEDDHSWQFLDNETFEAKDAALVTLSSVVGLDSSLIEVADLPPGWIATRCHFGAPWLREPAPRDLGDEETAC